MMQRTICYQVFNKMALNTFTMQDKMHVIIFGNFKSKTRDNRVVESSDGHNLLSMDFFFQREL